MKYILISLLLFSSNSVLAKNDPELKKLLDKMNDLWSGRSSKGSMTMEVKNNTTPDQ